MARAGAAMSEPLCDMSVGLQSVCCGLVYFQTAGGPVRQLVAGEVGLQPIQIGMGAAEEAGRIPHAEAVVRESKQRAVSVGGELVAHHTVLDDRLLPFVFEHVRWIPHQDAAGHPFAFGWQRWPRRDHVDGAAFTGFDRRYAEPLL